jgi:tetratricopeptide (TPR) repeat protein
VNTRIIGWQDKAIAAFEEAIRLDENYAPPYAGLAVALKLDYRNDDQAAARESAVRAAETAIELDPELAEGHAALGLLLLDDGVLLGDPETKLERAERSLRRALELDPSLSIAYHWLSNALRQQGRIEEANAVQEQGLLIDPLNPILSANIASRLTELGERERAERLLLRLVYLPARPAHAYVVLWWHYFSTGQFDKTLHWSKDNIRAYVASEGPDSSHAGYLAWEYERLGLIEDADYWMADAMLHTLQPEDKFYYKVWQLLIRGDQAGVRAEIDNLRTALGTDIDGLQGIYAAMYAAANIYVGNFDVGIDVFENAFDSGSLPIVYDMGIYQGLEFSHALAYAYQQVGRDDEADVLLNRLHEQLNTYVVEENIDFGPLHHTRAQNFGLRGDFDAAADALEAAIKAGWLRYIWVMNDPTWAETIAYPRIARMLEDVRIELERQRAVVEQADAEHDFRAEFAALQSARGD